MKRTMTAAALALLLLTGCSGGDQGGEPAATPTTPPTPSVSATPVPITGDLGADLAAKGSLVGPDVLSSYDAYMTPYICESPLGEGEGVRFKDQVARFADGQTSIGEGPDALRLIVAYHCPDRAGNLEAELLALAGTP